MAPRNYSPGVESVSSRENGIGHTIVVKTTTISSTGTWYAPGALSSTDFRPDSAASSDRSSSNEESHTGTFHRPSSTYPLTNGLDPSHKRKRSDEDNGQRSSTHRQYDFSPPKRVEQPQHMADRALHVLDSDQPSPYYSNGRSVTTNGHWNHDQQSPPPSATSTQANGAHDQSWDVTTPTDGQPYEQKVNGAMPKRKRNFANRTKSGCMTCRKRKKKCDEGRPHCKFAQPTRAL